ncbi:T9SS type A sorting domain-containing protein [Hymenobacter sp. 15J16-1T3B]|uniref:T9SS type A sorting domain-containing protein n=1 Tax=Hymenobacter sp. 15J16-1T3B TaxID=2886941 RepID=UPI001D0F5C11|nr:T9SS type A sorting domain-containing protein [Hymenobacter sp. 15J16-1T3B]MCC3159175.1 T9SS type A sorting domain-containing protein [Hymenobacter sp. 15J16-1T3B]
MRFSLPLLALGLLSSVASQAQSASATPWLRGVARPDSLLASGPAYRTTADVKVPGRIVSYTWSSGARAWTTPVLRTSTYDANARLLVDQLADSATQVPSQRTTYTYTPAGRVSSTLLEEWNSGSLVPVKLSTYTYDAQNRVIHSLAQMWQNGAWENNFRILISWDANGNETERTGATWTNGAWLTRSGTQRTYRYSASGSVLELTTSGWIIPTGGFSPGTKEIYTYGANPQQYTSYVVQLNSAGTFVNTTRVGNVQYDAQGRQTYYETETWNAGAWQLTGRYTLTYAASGPGYVTLAEARSGNSWTTSYRVSDTYDANGSSTGLYVENWTNNAWVPSSGQRYLLRYNVDNVVDRRVVQTASSATGTFVNASMERYSNFVTAARGAARLLAAVELYPNPSAGSVMLRLDGLRQAGEAQAEVLNALGQVVQRRRLRVGPGLTEHQLDLSALPAGLYSVRLQTVEGVATKSVVRR